MKAAHLVMAFLLVAGCGGSDDGSLYGGSGGSSSGGQPDASPSGGTAGGGAPSGGAGGLAGSSGSAGATQTGGAAGAAAGGTSSGGTAATGGSGGSASGGSPGVGTGHCGAATCAFAAGDACCKSGDTSLYCSNGSLNNPCKCSGIACHSFEIRCDGPEDCGAKLCCAESNWFGTEWDVVECRETCTSDQIGPKRQEVCHVGGAPCKNGTPCLEGKGLPPGYGLCGA